MIVRLADCPSQPWKNGLGRTRELAAQTSSGEADAFDWRVSIAEVDSAAPFSCFPGIDRHIVLLDGAGFTLQLDGRRTHALTTPFEPFAFAGEAAVTVALAGGPTGDFNLMLRRDRLRGGVEIWREAGPREAAARVVLVYCARGIIDCPGGTLQAGDAWQGHGQVHAFSLHRNALALAVWLEAV